MPERVPGGGASGASSGPGKLTSVAFTDAEAAVIQDIASIFGLSFEEAVQSLATGGLARRVRAKLGKRPSASVRRFHREGR